MSQPARRVAVLISGEGSNLQALLDAARAGQAASPEAQAQFAAYLMLYFGKLDAKRGWTKQLHLGAMRNNNTRLMKQLGPDTGFDSIDGGTGTDTILGATGTNDIIGLSFVTSVEVINGNSGTDTILGDGNGWIDPLH